MSWVDDKLAAASGILDDGVATYKPRRVFSLLSGGHDSLTATAVAFEWARKRRIDTSAVHIQTGTGIPQTTEFVRAVCLSRGWPLRVYQPPVSYEDLVMEYGFPGPGNHGLMYQRLKERCLRILVREAKTELVESGEAEQREYQQLKIGLVTGVRAQESVRRMRHVERVQREGSRIWLAAIWDWSKSECARLLKELDLPRNPVVDLLHMSGECLCGAFARPGEIKEIEAWFPEHAEWIHALERRAQQKGLRGCVWGQRPPRVHREQMEFPDAPEPGPLCTGCELAAV